MAALALLATAVTAESDQSYASIKDKLRELAIDDPVDALLATVLGGGMLFYALEQDEGRAAARLLPDWSNTCGGALAGGARTQARDCDRSVDTALNQAVSRSTRRPWEASRTRPVSPSQRSIVSFATSLRRHVNR